MGQPPEGVGELAGIDRLDRPQGAAVHQLEEACPGSRILEVVHDCEDEARPTSGFDKLGCPTCRQRERLLAETVPPSPECRLDQIRMRERRRADDEALRVSRPSVVQGRPPVRQVEGAGSLLGSLSMTIDDADHFNPRLTLEGGQVSRARHPAGADRDDLQRHGERVARAAAIVTI